MRGADEARRQAPKEAAEAEKEAERIMAEEAEAEEEGGPAEEPEEALILKHPQGGAGGPLSFPWHTQTELETAVLNGPPPCVGGGEFVVEIYSEEDIAQTVNHEAQMSRGKVTRGEAARILAEACKNMQELRLTHNVAQEAGDAETAGAAAGSMSDDGAEEAEVVLHNWPSDDEGPGSNGSRFLGPTAPSPAEEVGAAVAAAASSA